MEVEQLFRDGLVRLGIDLGEEQLVQFYRYRNELLDWNTRMNLTAITDPGEVLIKHFLDSLSLLAVNDIAACSLLDIGSGAGFPGLPLKIARPSWRVVLLEATGKKVVFLRHVIGVLGLEKIEVVQGRAEELVHKEKRYRAAFNCVTARAVASLPSLLEYCAPYCRVGGTIVLPRKGDLAEELAQSKRAGGQLGVKLRRAPSLELPGLSDGRRLFVWEQVKRCPEAYPRAGAAVLKNPLG